MAQGNDDEPVVHSISSLPVSRKADQAARMRHYTIAMVIRTVCFAAAGVFVLVFDVAWAAWVCLFLAVVLPYPAVVVANNTNRRTHDMEPAGPVHVLTAQPHGEHWWQHRPEWVDHLHLPGGHRHG